MPRLADNTNRGAAKRVHCVVDVDAARSGHIPRIARAATSSRAQAHVLRYSLHPYGKAPAICRSVYYLHLSNFSDILSHQWSSRSNISLALISSERSSLQAVSVQEDCYNSGQLSPEGLFSSSSHPQTLLGCCWLSMHQCRCLLLS